MQTYLVLLHEGTTIRPDMSPEEMQAVIARYKAWGQRLHASGRLVSSNKLENEPGACCAATTGKSASPIGPFTETKDVLGGYFLIQAESYEEAAELCRDTPHLDFGVVEVRRIEVV